MGRIGMRNRFVAAGRIALLSIAVCISGCGQAEDDLAALDAQVSDFYQEGKYSDATEIAKRSLALTEKKFGPDHPNVGNALNNLAELYRSQGRLAEAEPLYKRSLSVYEKALGPDHPDVGTSLNNLAAMYRSLGRTTEAEPLYKRSLALREKALGADHPAVGSSLNNLALLYQSQGRYAEAEPLYKRSLSISVSALGPDHPAVGSSLNNLAELYRSQGHYSEAEPLFKRSLSITETAKGPDHPDVGTSLNNLAALYLDQGRITEVEPLHKRAIAIAEKSLGRDHPSVANSLNNLAGLYLVQGRYGEAEPIYKRSLGIFEKALGSDHDAVGLSLNGLAELYRAQGRYGEAEPLYKRSFAISEKALGTEYSEAGTSLNNLALLYVAQGRTTEAEPLFKRSLAIREKSLGPDHPSVAATLNNLAGLYYAQGRTTEAEPLFKRALTVLEKALGPGHHHVATSLNNLAVMYLAQGRYDESEPILRRNLTLRENALGPDHPDLAQSLNNLAELYKIQDRYGEAEVHLKRSLAISEKSLGPDHPDIAGTLDNLAGLGLSRRDWHAAAHYWKDGVTIFERRAKRGLATSTKGTEKQEAARNDFHYRGLIKVTHRLVIEGRDARPQSVDEMFEAAQWSQASEAAASVAQMAVRSTSRSRELSTLAREHQDLVAEWQAKDRLLVQVKSNPPERRHTPNERLLADRLAAIDTRLGEIDATFAREFPDYAALSSPKPVPLTDVQANLRDDEVLVLFLDTDGRFKPLPEETFIWVVTKTDVRWVRSDLGTASLTREVAALRCGLDVTAWNGDGAKRCAELLKLAPDKLPKLDAPLPFDANRAHNLYKALFGEVADLIKGKNLLLVPSGPLTQLPFQVLVTEPPKGADHKSIRWLARDHALTVLPAVSSLEALRRVSRPSAATKPMIGFGNPLLDGDQAHPRYGAESKLLAAQAKSHKGCAQVPTQRTATLRGISRGAALSSQPLGPVDTALVRQQTPLPETADELCTVARDLNTDVAEIRLGVRATEREIKALSASGQLADYRILHFATHATLAGQLKGTTEPGLILTPPATATEDDDGYLSAGEIAALKLDADWVILSACNTAGGSEGSAEALSGLARAFFYAQARALLVSHWEVNSDATVRLITSAVGTIGRDKTVGRAEARRRAMMAMIDNGTPDEAHPSNWAPFVVVGEGAAQM